MPDYRRSFVPGGCYFFTVNLRNRRRTLLVDHIDQLREAFRKVKRQRPFRIDALVVLPDHIHCVWTLPDGDADYPGRWRAIKTAFSKSVGEVGLDKNGKSLWQPRYWEHTILSQQDFIAHVDYVHINPQKHGLVRAVIDWSWSTFHRYVESGVYARNWAGGLEEQIAGGTGERL